MTVRIDSCTGAGSVLDVIRVCTRSSSNRAATVLRMLQQGQPDFACSIRRAKINGRAKLTPVADMDTLCRIAQLCCHSMGTDCSSVLAHVHNGCANAKQQQQHLRRGRSLVRKQRPGHSANRFGPLSAIFGAVAA